MEFGFSKQQKMIVDSAKSFLKKEAEGIVREVEKTNEGYSPQLWQKMASLGWMGIMLPEEFGGEEGSFIDLVLILEEMGKALLPGPFIPVTISGLAILKYGTESQKREFLPRITEGDFIVSPALTVPDPKLGDSMKEDRFDTTEGKYVLSGTRLFVPYAHVADLLLYGVYTDKSTTLFLLDTKNPCVTCNPLDSIGDNKPCEVTVEKVEVSEGSLLGKTEKGEEIVNGIEQWGALAESAYIIGMLEQILEMAVEYSKERQQFGRKIGSFQAIQHQAANMLKDIDQAKFLTYEAAWKLSEGLTAKKEIAMAKAWASDSSRRCALLGVTIQGGMGVSEENDMQLYFRRAKESEIAFGDGDFHREIVAKELGL